MWLGSEPASLEEWSGDIVVDAAEAEHRTAEMVKATIDRFCGFVAGAGPVEVAQDVLGTAGQEVTMTTRYAVRVNDPATAEETTLNRTSNHSRAINTAEKEAERLAEMLGRTMDTDATRSERDGWGRYVVWMPLGDNAETAAYIVTVEEEAQNDFVE